MSDKDHLWLGSEVRGDSTKQKYSDIGDNYNEGDNQDGKDIIKESRVLILV